VIVRGGRETAAWAAIAAVALGAAPSCGARTPLGLAEGTVPEHEAVCGDGRVDADEACDDANDRSDDACVGCEQARCGDGVVRAGFEACDDGNDDPGDGCTDRCALGNCGDGVVDPGEECDDANDVETDACPGACLDARCGDGVVFEGVEECDGGPGNDDRPAAYVVQGELIRSVRPVETDEDVATFYDYRSASSHTGFEEVRKGATFLHRERGGPLSLVTIFGIDIDEDGIAQGEGEVVQTFSGIPDGVFVSIADDRLEEFDFVDAATAVGHWHFQDNTDGAAMSSLPWPGDYAIGMSTDLLEGIDEWAFLDAGVDRIALSQDEDALLVVQTGRSTCRLDCTIPRCGDGRLDAGETCDDGNTSPGDGCAPDCIGQ
jgi:cysteine-rich repeat protein